MASYNKIADWVVNIHKAIVNLSSDTITAALSNTAPGSETTPPTGDGHGVIANVTEISYTNCSSRNATITSSSQTSGTYSFILADLTLTASGTVGPFRYIYIYDNTPTSPADPIICYFDYGSSLTLNNGDTFKLDFDNVNGLYQLA